MNTEKVYIVSAYRSAIGKFGGSLSKVSARTLGSAIVKETLKRAAIPFNSVSEVLFGCCLQAGLGQNIARQISIDAGLPKEIPATTINNVCGSGLKTVTLGAALIHSGEADIVVTGGVEIMSQAPYLLSKARFGYRMGNSELIDSMVSDSLFDSFEYCHMGVTAENIANVFNISRNEQDTFALDSQIKCQKARENGVFDEEIIPIEVIANKEKTVFKNDENPREGLNIESLSKLNPAFKKEGTVTAGNSSSINDGASCVVIASEKAVKEYNLRPLVEIVNYTHIGCEPATMGLGAGYAGKRVLEKAGLNISDIDLVEANEAFSSQSIASSRIGGWDAFPEKVNVNGGAISLGHPIGASGSRILVTLIHELKRRNGNFGLATLCVGGGMGVSVLVKNVK